MPFSLPPALPSRSQQYCRRVHGLFIWGNCRISGGCNRQGEGEGTSSPCCFCCADGELTRQQHSSGGSFSPRCRCGCFAAEHAPHHPTPDPGPCCEPLRH
ncbi:unnamed protein product, partial [Pylaiella littoralis]